MSQWHEGKDGGPQGVGLVRPKRCLRSRAGWAAAMIGGVMAWLLGVRCLGDTYTYPLAGGAIGVGGTTEFAVPVPEDVFIGQVEIRLALEVGETGFVDYLDVSLVSPTGVAVKLLSSGLGGDEEGFLGGVVLQDTLLSEAGAVAIESGAEPYAGTFKVDDWTTASGLGVFAALRSGGTWRLRIRDDGHAGGTLYGVANLGAASWGTMGTALVVRELPAEQRPPLMLAATDSGRLANDAVTANATPTFTGLADAGSVVRLMRVAAPAVELGSTTADGGGAWSVTIPLSAALEEGLHSIFAEVTRPGAGPVQTIPLAVTIDQTPPTLTSISDLETNEDMASPPALFVVSDNLSPVAQLGVAGTCEPASLASQVMSGGAGAARSIVVQPAAGQKGEGIVTVAVTDLAGNTAQRSFALTVLDVNVPPVLGADTVTRVAGDRVAKVLASELLANDTDADGDVLVMSSVSSPNPAGAVVRVAGPFVVFSMPMGASGPGSFVYTVSDQLGGHLVNRVVNVVESAMTAAEEVALPLSVTAEGADAVLRWIGVPRRQYQVQYTTSLAAPHAWRDFTPVALHVAARSGVPGLFAHRDVAPPDSLRLYRAVPVGWDNAPPAVVADKIQRLSASREATVLAADLLANDSDPDADGLSIVWVGTALPDGATVAMEGSAVVYTAPASNEAPGTFEYEVSDGAGGHRVRGTVTVEKVE